MYEGKPLEQALAPLQKRLVEATLQGEMPLPLQKEKLLGSKNRHHPREMHGVDLSEAQLSTRSLPPILHRANLP
jgi:hypothetical protein